MSQTEESLERLGGAVKAGRRRLDRDGDLDRGYITGIVIPLLKAVLADKIEEHHKIDETFVIHYTSIGALVSILQKAAKNKQEAMKNDQESSKNAQNASLRLYDSVHFNDPDEGNYFYRHLNLPKKYDWLDEKKETHAYVASFIIPDTARDMSDDLVFWRTYGKDGEGCSLKLKIPKGQLRKVLYGVGKVKATRKKLRPILDPIIPLIQIKHKEIRTQILEAVHESLGKIRYLYKSEAYRYERECRFVIPELDTEKDKIVFEESQQSDSSVSPRHYYECNALKVEKILVTDSVIRLGPCVSNVYNVTYYIERLLDKAELFGAKIELSTINYRKS